MSEKRDVVQAMLQSMSVIHEEATKLKMPQPALQDFVSRVYNLVNPVLVQMLEEDCQDQKNTQITVSMLFPLHTAIASIKALVIKKINSQSQLSSCQSLVDMETSKAKAEIGAASTMLLRAFERICARDLNREMYDQFGPAPPLVKVRTGSHVGNVPWRLYPNDLTIKPSEQQHVGFDGGWTTTIGLLKGRKTVTVSKAHGKSQNCSRETFCRHAVLLYQTLHPNLVTLVGVVFDDEDTSSAASCTIVTEPCLHETLLIHLERGCLVDLKSKQEMVKGLIQGLAYLHSQALCYGRIDPSNVVVDSAGNPQYTVFEYFECFRMSAVQPSSSSEWASPEQINGTFGSKQSLPASDLYSFGLLAALVLTSCTHARKPTTRPQLVHDLYGNDVYTRMIELCTRENPFQRPSADAVACVLLVGIDLPDTILFPRSVTELYQKLVDIEGKGTDPDAEQSRWCLIGTMEEAILEKDYHRVLAMIKNKPDDPRLLCAACHALSAMMMDKNPKVPEGIRRNHGVDILFSCMESCKDNIQVQIAGCEMIGDLEFNTYETTKRVVKLQVIEKVLTLMRKYNGNSSLQQAGSSILLNSCVLWQSPAIPKLLKTSGLEVVVSAISRHNDNSLVLIHCVQIWCLLLQFDDRFAEKIARAGGVEALIGAIPKLKNFPRFQVPAFRILFLIISSRECEYADTSGWSLCADELLSFIELRGHTVEPEHLDWLLQMLPLMLQRDEAMAENIGFFGIQVVLSVMQQHRSDCSIQREALHVLHDFLSKTDQQHGMAVAQLAGLELMVSALDQDFQDMSLYLFGCAAISMCLEQNVSDLMCIIDEGYVTILLSTMARFKYSANIHGWCCRALSTIAVHAPGVIQHLAITKENIRALNSSTMKYYAKNFPSRQDESVHFGTKLSTFVDETFGTIAVPERCEIFDYFERQETDPRILRFFAYKDSEQFRTEGRGNLEVLLESMTEHKEGTFLHAHGCNLISIMASAGEDIRNRIAKTNAVEVVLLSMRENPENQLIQQAGITTLSAFSSKDDSLLHRMVDNGGIELMISVMQSYQQVIHLQELCCYLISVLSYHEEIIERMVQANVVEVVVATMSLYSLNEKIQFQGCQALALCTISFGSEVINKIAKAGGMQVLKSAAVIHRSDQLIQKNSFTVLAEIALQGQDFLQQIYRSFGLKNVPTEEISSFQLAKVMRTQVQKKLEKNRKDVDHQSACQSPNLRQKQTSNGQNSQSSKSRVKRELNKSTNHREVQSQLTDERIEEILKSLEPERERTSKNKGEISKGQQGKKVKPSADQDISQPRVHNEKISPSDVQAVQGKKVDKACDKDFHEEEDRDMCVICLEGKSTHAYIPCGHLAVCEECKSKSSSVCPICNQESVMCTRIFRPTE
eukprot:234808-Hanusia_phi.AAC.1